MCYLAVSPPQTSFSECQEPCPNYQNQKASTTVQSQALFTSACFLLPTDINCLESCGYFVELKQCLDINMLSATRYGIKTTKKWLSFPPLLLTIKTQLLLLKTADTDTDFKAVVTADPVKQ